MIHCGKYYFTNECVPRYRAMLEGTVFENKVKIRCRHFPEVFVTITQGHKS
jgi:hypothetical protein